MSEICIHDWKFANEAEYLFCTKCEAVIYHFDIINHITRLESELANEREIFGVKQTLLAEIEQLQSRLADAEVKSKQWLDKAHMRLLDLERTKTMVEALIEAGTGMYDRIDGLYEDRQIGYYPKCHGDWYELVAIWERRNLEDQYLASMKDNSA